MWKAQTELWIKLSKFRKYLVSATDLNGGGGGGGGQNISSRWDSSNNLRIIHIKEEENKVKTH